MPSQRQKEAKLNPKKIGSPALRASVTNSPGYKKDAVYKCSVLEGTADAIQCRIFSSKPENNKICKESKCRSVWRACDTCIENKSVAKQTSLIERETGKCLSCTARAANESTSSSKVSKTVRKKRVTRSRNDGPRDINTLLQEVMKTASAPRELKVSEIRRFKEQPRLFFNSQALEELGRSLESAQIIPVFVRELTRGELVLDRSGAKYELIDGERRWRACQIVGKLTIIAIKLDVPDKETQHAISAIANFGRADHTPIEEALAIKFMQKNLQATNEEIAKHFAKSVPWLYQRLSLLKLDESVQKLMMPGDHVKRPMKVAIGMLLAEMTSEHVDVQKQAARHIVDRPEITAAGAEKYIEALLADKGVKIERKKSRKIEGPVKTSKALNNFVNNTWDRLETLLAVPDSTFRMLPLSSEESATIKSNLASIEDKIQRLQKRL